MADTITIRTTDASDIAAVDALLARSYPALLKDAYPPSVLVTAVPIIARAQPALVTCGTYYVAEDAAGRALAAGGWTRSQRRRERAEIRHVATDPAATRRGVGRALMWHILEAARAEGIAAVDCTATRNAVPFYSAMGFVEIGPTEVPLAPGIVFPAVRMARGP